jgi:tetratricopeptide (TPR) repeat protein
MLTNSTYSLLPEAYRALRSLFRLGLLSTLLAVAGIGNAWAIAGVDFSSYELADALNLLGFSLRSADRNTEAMEKYNEALAIDPDHQGALEYQGELFLKMGDQDSAEANLEKLTELCPDGCEAHAILQTAIEKFKDGIEVSWVRPTN